MGLAKARLYGAVSKNGDGVSTNAIFTIVAEILKRQREDESKNESAADDSHDSASVVAEQETKKPEGSK